MNLTKLQERLLNSLVKDVWVNVLDIPNVKINMNTVWSLKDKGLLIVEARYDNINNFIGYFVKKI